METNQVWQPAATVQTVLPDRRARANRPQPRQRFKILPFTNRGGSESWRVTGIKRDGGRIRENHFDANSARCRQTELEAEYLARASEGTALRSTHLTDVQARIAEAVFPMLDRDEDLIVAINYWRQHGSKHAVVESPRIDDAVEQYVKWLDIAPLRDATKRHWRTRMNVFKNNVQNVRVSDVTPETIENYLAKRNTSPGGKDTDRRAISRFLSWCIERPRRWVVSNPAREVKIDLGETAPPAILAVVDCENLLRAAEKHKGGILVPYLAACLFAGIRPDEAKRTTWQQINLADMEIRLEANQTKTKRSRVVTIHPTLAKWLKSRDKKPFYPVNGRKEFDAVRLAAGLTSSRNDGAEARKPFPHDVMRHTAISHFFRDTGSYGKAAEQFGNSEAIIKKHYQGRVSTADTKKFYAIKPKEGKG